MTSLTRPVRRKAGEFSVVLIPGSIPLMLIKKGRTRKWFELTLEAAYCIAVKIEVRRETEEKRRRRELRRKS